MILGERFYQMSNAIFHYDLTPAEFMVYNYLVSCAGQKDMCWPSVHKIALNCNCSENTARKAIDAPVKKRFIRRVATYEEEINMDNIINELYYGNICPVEQMGRLTPETKAILKRINENEKELEKSLNEQEKTIFHSIQDDRLELAASVGEKRFWEAFALGVRLAVEVFSGEPNISRE